ncbi:MAG: zinc ribbon domain-containing protein [Chloroflexi bacterium]|nr:zinc ribbon domain-containing protein [Chloroflexota bacterium]
MPKLIPVPDEISQPFWDAVNGQRLVVQHCLECDALQHPPRPACQDCGASSYDWKETSGRGTIVVNLVVMDSHLQRRVPDQPFNIAVVALDDDPRINFYANVPGAPVGEVPAGSPVRVVFEEVSPGEFVHDWELLT